MTRRPPLRLLLSFVGVAVLSGCSGSAAGVVAGAPVTAQSIAFSDASDSTHANVLYVSDQLQKAVLGFPAGLRAGNPAPSVTIPLGVIPQGIWVDRAGILYVAVSNSSPTQPGAVEEFRPGATAPFRTVTDGITVPQAVIVDHAGNMYVSQVFDTAVQVVEYPAGSTSPGQVYSITDKGEPEAGNMTFDRQGNLYVDTLFIDDPPARVFEIVPGSSTPHALALRDRGEHVGIASNERGVLYVADAENGIALYPFGKTSPTRKIVPPENAQFALFVATRAGALYVPNEGLQPDASSLIEYRGPTRHPANVLSGHLQAPFSAALRAAAF
jgi:hypothetical protein